MTVPDLLTDRLRLRAHGVADHDAASAMWADAGVVRHIGGKPFTPSDVWARMLRYRGMWSMLGYGFWLIEERASGAFLGEIGLMDARRDIDPPITEIEVGWALASTAWGKGIATEALRAVVQWADTQLGAATLVCMIEDGNDASIAVAGKFGFVPYARADYGGAAVTLLRRARP